MAGMDDGGNCPYWQDYDSLAGRVCFCALAAFGKDPRPSALRLLGCTPEKRRGCFETMRQVMGAGCVPGGVESAEPGAADARRLPDRQRRAHTA